MRAVQSEGLRQRHRLTITLVGALTLTAITVVGLQSPTLSRWIVVLAIGVLMLGIGANSPRHLLMLLLCWLPILGLVRRLFPEAGTGTLGDPFLIVGPLGVVVLLAAVTRRGKTLPQTRLSRAVMLLQGTLLLSAVNPLQGGPMVGLAGLMLVLVPTLAFWIGRELGDDCTVRQVITLVAVIGLLGALYGLAQTFWGLPSWDRRWVNEKGYAALSVGGHTRAFGSFSAASEYTQYLGIALIAWFTVRGRLTRIAALVGPAAVILLALWLAGSRGIIVTVIAAAGLVLAARFRVSFPITAVMTVVVLATLPSVVQALAPTQADSRNLASAAATRQVEGLSDPFGEVSTLPVHIQLLTDGLAEAVRLPTGRGVGAVTLAADRFSDGSFQTEADPSDMAVAAGLVGLVAYLAVAAISLSTAWSLVKTARSGTAMFILGALVVAVLSWLTGGNYSTALLVWLFIGMLDRTQSTDPPTQVTNARQKATPLSTV